MSQKIVESVASLRDSLARLSQRGFDDFAVFQSVTGMQFRSNEVSKRLAIALAAGHSAPGDDAVALRVFTAGGKVSVAQPTDHASVAFAVSASGHALDSVDNWLAQAAGPAQV